jgi:hypothetical protein
MSNGWIIAMTDRSIDLQPLIRAARLDQVFSLYPEDVLVGLQQATSYNETIAAQGKPLPIPGAGILPETSR